MYNLKNEIIEDVKVELKEIFVLKYIFLIGSNGIGEQGIDKNKDIDFVLIVDDSVDIFECLKQLSLITKKIIVKFNIQLNIYPIQESVYINGNSMFLDNIRNHNERIL